MLIYDNIKDFFEPKYIEYEIYQSLNEVLKKFDNAFENQVQESNIKGLSGQISGNEFTMGLMPGEEGASFSAALKGEITEKKTRITILRISIMRDSSTYLTFALAIIASAIYLFMYFNNKSLTALYCSLGSIILGFIFSIWFSNKSVSTIQRQFENFMEANDLRY